MLELSLEGKVDRESLWGTESNYMENSRSERTWPPNSRSLGSRAWLGWGRKGQRGPRHAGTACLSRLRAISRGGKKGNDTFWQVRAPPSRYSRNLGEFEIPFVVHHSGEAMQWTWVWVDSGGWWWTGKPGVLQSRGLQRVGHDWVTELNWTGYFLLVEGLTYFENYQNVESLNVFSFF